MIINPWKTRDLLKAGHNAALAFVLTVAALAGIQLQAQVFAAHDSKAPVNYAADRSELQDREKRVILSGNVDITQDRLRLQAARTVINYTDEGSLQIQRITATGGVRVTQGDQAASGDTAIYDFNRRIITVAGNVRLRRSGDMLEGGRLVIDLASGVSSVDGRASGASSASGSSSGEDDPSAASARGRVTGSFSVPKQ